MRGTMNDPEKTLRLLETGAQVGADGLALLCAAKGPILDQLFASAAAVRRQKFGRSVHLRALIEFSSYCRCQCGYCGLSARSGSLVRYRMSGEEIVEAARKAVAAGFRTVVLQSGEDFGFSCAEMCAVIRSIKEMGDTAVTLSMGERTRGELERFREAGADRYLMKHETALASLYAGLHPGASYEKRLGYYALLHDLGYQVGGGFMVGLPPWDASALAANLLLLRSLKVHMAGIGPFLPAPGTPLEGFPAGSPQETLKAVALARLLLPDAMLPATTALEVSAEGKKLTALEYGANVLMLQATPARYRNLYKIYPKPENLEDCAALYEKTSALLQSAGFFVASGRGDAASVSHA